MDAVYQGGGVAPLAERHARWARREPVGVKCLLGLSAASPPPGIPLMLVHAWDGIPWA